MTMTMMITMLVMTTNDERSGETDNYEFMTMMNIIVIKI